MQVSIEIILKPKGMLCNPNSYIVKYLVFSVSTTTITHTKKQVNSYILSLLPQSLLKKGEPGSSNFLQMCKTLCFNQVLAPPLLSVTPIKRALAKLHASC